MRAFSTDLRVRHDFQVRPASPFPTRSATLANRVGRLGVAPTTAVWDPVERATMAEEMEATTVELDPGVEERVAGLIEAGRPADCVDLSEVDSLVQEMDLSDEEEQVVHERIESAGLSIEDDCGKRQAEQAGYKNGDLAEQTTDALQLFFNEMRKYPLLTK